MKIVLVLFILFTASFVSSQQVPLSCHSLAYSGVCVVGSASSSGEVVSDAAAKYVGRLRYVWGGTSLETGADCSGFVQQLFAQYARTSLPRTAAEQLQKGVPVSREQLQPGDVVFFANTYKRGISHVGVYVGEGPYGKCSYIHAPGRGKLVKYGSLCSGGSSKECSAGSTTGCFAGARRVSDAELAA